MALKVGMKVKDRLTEFTGVVVCRTEYLYGCVRVGVQPSAMKDSVPVGEQWFDEDRFDPVEDVSRKVGLVAPKSKATTGAFGDPQSRGSDRR